MLKVSKGRQSSPRRVLIYGTHGIGKSSWASCAPSPIFIDLEDGTKDIHTDRVQFDSSPEDVTLDEFYQQLHAIYSEDHDYKTLVIDSVDRLELLLWRHVCQQNNKDSIEAFGYGKGYTVALESWREFTQRIDLLRTARNMTVILIGHAKIERFENPETKAYDRYTPKLHKSASAYLQEWCDEVFFATYQVAIRKAESKNGKPSAAKGIGAGERILKTTERPSHLAKSRLNLPDEIALDYSVYEGFLKGTV